MKLKAAMLFVKDFPKMKDFYGELLHANPVNTESTDSWALFETGFALHAIPEEIARNVQISSPPRPRETSAVKLIFAVDDVVAERKRLEALGVTLLPKPWQQPAESCDAMDPEGNVFQIAAAEK
jgi:predicted enzyme related to lactoylglutathione lyase